MKSNDLVVAVDLGTYSIKILVSPFLTNTTGSRVAPKIITYFNFPIKKKPILSLDEQILEALSLTEKKAKTSLKDAYYIFSIPESFLTHREQAIELSIDDGIIKTSHLRQINHSLLENNKLNITNTTKNYIIDDQYHFSDPTDIKAHTLKVNSHIISWTSQEKKQEYELALSKTKTNKTYFPEILTLPYTHQKKLEKKLFINLGGKKTTFLHLNKELVEDFGSIPIGLSTIINDLSEALKLTATICLNILKQDLEQIYKDDSPYSLYLCKTKKCPRYIPIISIQKIINIHLKEIFQAITQNINTPQNIILTGAGTHNKSLITIIKNFFPKNIIISNADYPLQIPVEEKQTYSTAFALLCRCTYHIEEKKITNKRNNLFNKVLNFFSAN